MNLSDVAAQCMLKGMLAEATTCLKVFLKENPRDGQALLNFATLCRRTNRLDEAMEMVNIHLDSSMPQPLPEVWLIFGLLCEDFGRFEEAATAFRRYQGFKPHDQNAAIAHGSSLMRLQRFDEGFPDWDFGRFLMAWRPQEGVPIWQGEDLKGKRLLIIKEGGYGDVFMFSRWIPKIVAAGAAVDLDVWDCLHPVLHHRSYHLLKDGEPHGTLDFCCSLLSLPRLCGMHSIADIPPSIQIPRTPRFAKSSNPMVGLCWRAEENGETRQHRSMLIEDLAPLEEVKAGFFSLCPDTETPDWIEEYKLGKGTWEATRDLLSNMDLVITVDTAVAHLAGCMGLPTWLLLPMYSSWQWFTPQAFPASTPWYPSVRVFRQKDPLSWKGVIEEVKEALERGF